MLSAKTTFNHHTKAEVATNVLPNVQHKYHHSTVNDSTETLGCQKYDVMCDNASTSDTE